MVIFSLALLTWHTFPKSEIESSSCFWTSKIMWPLWPAKISFAAWGSCFRYQCKLKPQSSWRTPGWTLTYLPLLCPYWDFPGCPWFTPASFQVTWVCQANSFAGKQRNPDSTGTLWFWIKQCSEGSPWNKLASQTGLPHRVMQFEYPAQRSQSKTGSWG